MVKQILENLRANSENIKVCCGHSIDDGCGGSFDHPPDPPRCCGEPNMLHDVLDDAITRLKEIE